MRCRDHSSVIRVTAALAALLLAGASVHAQVAVTQLSIAGGTATDARGVRSTTVTASPGLVLYPGAPLSLALSASGSRFQESGWQAGGDASLSGRSAEWARTRLTLNASGGYARTSYRATFAVGEATPALETRLGPVTAFGGFRVATGQTTVRSAPAVGAPAPPVLLASVTRSSRGPVYGAQWQVTSGAAPLLVSVREDRARVLSEMVVDRSASVTLSLGRLMLGGSAGRRASPSETAAFSSGSVSLSLTPGIALQGSAGRYPSSRLTGAASGRYVSLGLFLRSGAPRPQRLPRPAGVPGVRGTATRLTIRALDAARVELAGDWNDWAPIPARRASNGVWYVDVDLPPGEYRYAFRVDGGAWRVPEGAVTSDDGFGGRTAYVTVSKGTARHTSFSQEER